MWVLKIGGSLETAPQLRGWLTAAVALPGQMVIVPGGGRLADGVRALDAHWDLPEATGHRMAVLAMEQMAHLFAGLEGRLRLAADRSEIERCLAAGGTPVWLPGRMLAAAAAPPASWSVTSDSLAAWLALQIQAEALVLVKSAHPPGRPVTLAALIADGIVDPYFATIAGRAAIPMYWVGREEGGGLKRAYAGDGPFPTPILPAPPVQ
jgi:aspartokinase-like uncharacterized kinase